MKIDWKRVREVGLTALKWAGVGALVAVSIVAQGKSSGGSRRRRSARPSKAPRKADFEAALHSEFDKARKRGKQHVDVQSGKLHRQVGGYPARSHRMPTACDVMRRAKAPGDRELKAPPKGKGASVVIRYKVPK